MPFRPAGGLSLSSFGGEGRGEEVPYLQAIGRFMRRRFPVSNRAVLRFLHGVVSRLAPSALNR